jgi:hypothetical protein
MTRCARPDVPLLDHEPVVTEAEERCPCERLDGAVTGGQGRPPVDGGTVTVDDGLAEPARCRRLASECPLDVLSRYLAVAEGM